MRAVVSVGTGAFQVGLKRLEKALADKELLMLWRDSYPQETPSSDLAPYAFKIYALEATVRLCGATTLLWCDSSIVPIRSLEPIWERIKTYGYWFSRNYSYTNGNFCADEALPILGVTREESYNIPQVIAGAFGLDLEKHHAQLFLAEWKRLALAGAFRGAYGSSEGGHRHDQTAASVIVYRMGWELTNPPYFIAESGQESDETILSIQRIR